MPPILVGQRVRCLSRIVDKKTGKPLSTIGYEGTLKQRHAINHNTLFVPISYGLLRNDFDRLTECYSDKKVGMAVDEGHAIKNISSQPHKAVRQFSEGRPLSILMGHR